MIAPSPNSCPSCSAPATAWAEEDTRLGKGRVVTIADSNWSDRSNFTGTNEEFLENVAHYLSRQ